MPVTIHLPEELATEIDSVSNDRSTFVVEAVRQALRERSAKNVTEEAARIDAVANELNREYQVIRETR